MKRKTLLGIIGVNTGVATFISSSILAMSGVTFAAQNAVVLGVITIVTICGGLGLILSEEEVS
jgi:hypothetical protein